MFRSLSTCLLSSVKFIPLRGRLSSVARRSVVIAHRPLLILQSSSTYPITGTVPGIRLSSTNSQKATTAPKEKAKASKKKKPSHRQKKQFQAKYRTHLEAFFAQPEYEGFDYDPTKPYMQQFYRMTNHFGWDSKGTEEQKQKFQAAREGINKASVLQFNEIFGTDKKSVTAWRNLCSVLDVAYIPKSRFRCQEVIRSLYVNICDLLDSPALGTRVKKFDSEEELSVYTKRTGKFFPLEDAHAGGLLRFLLRQVLVPPAGPSPYPRPILRK
ncbi:unnamed protein product [Rhizoctonia solani]|uniref:Uncharacterized protein n=1 Tax=Rhizoctonia solani TaxID=456999 RepID=A0A8H3AZY6_9AGAM|nr:unnamed protein product [Rhizoctonia solani]